MLSCFLAIFLAGPLLQVSFYCAERAISQFFAVLLLTRMLKQEGKGRGAFTLVSPASMV